jgi:hypothetical protein
MDWRYATVPCECCSEDVHCAEVIYAFMRTAAEADAGEGDRPGWICPGCFLAQARLRRQVADTRGRAAGRRDTEGR